MPNLVSFSTGMAGEPPHSHAIPSLEPSPAPPLWWNRPAYLLAALGWLCAFGIVLAMVLGEVLVDGITIFGFLFSCFIALGASASGSTATKKPDVK